MDTQELKQQFNDFLQQAKIYFTTLSRNEQYGWVGVGVGVILLIVGLIML